MTTTTTHEITFTVEYFDSCDGGMRTDSYGGPTGELASAVALLKQAQVAYPKSDWVIVARVVTQTHGKEGV